MKFCIALLALVATAAFAQTKGKEVIDYKVPNSKAPEARTVIHPSGRVDTYQGTGRAADGSVTGAPAQRAHSVTAPSGQTTYHRATGNQVVTNSGTHVPRGGGGGGGGGNAGSTAIGGGGGLAPYKR